MNFKGFTLLVYFQCVLGVARMGWGLAMLSVLQRWSACATIQGARVASDIDILLRTNVGNKQTKVPPLIYAWVECTHNAWWPAVGMCKRFLDARTMLFVASPSAQTHFVTHIPGPATDIIHIARIRLSAGCIDAPLGLLMGTSCELCQFGKCACVAYFYSVCTNRKWKGFSQILSVECILGPH